MSQPAGFVWKGISFSWTATRASFLGALTLSGRMLLLFVRPGDTTGTWESWFEFNNWHTATCSMRTRDDALQGSVLELGSLFTSLAASAQELAARSSNPFHDHLDHCKQCAEKPFDLCEAGATLLATAATGET